MPSCVFRYCKNTSKNVKKSSKITFHRFLRPGEANRETWIKIIQSNRSEDTWLPSVHSCICSAHFNIDDFYLTKTGRRFLKHSAFPCSDPLELTAEDRHSSSTSLSDEEISDSESLRDPPGTTQLKNDLRKALDAKDALAAKVKLLQRQNRELKRDNDKLTTMVNELKETSRFETEIFIKIKEEVNSD